MQPRIKTIKEKKLVGKRIKMSLTDNKTGELWRGFIPRIKEINNRLSYDKISMQVYNSAYFENLDPVNEFEKWATVEVSGFNSIPKNLEIFNLPGGLYAVFDHKGSSNDSSIFEYIYTTWLPDSKYELDNRPHFEVLGEKYINNNPNSEEEIWIPIK